MPTLPPPVKPADGALDRWSKVYVDGDTWSGPEVYIPLVRAINERLEAARHLPLSEDQSHYQDNNHTWDTLYGEYALQSYSIGGSYDWNDPLGVNLHFYLSSLAYLTPAMQANGQNALDFTGFSADFDLIWRMNVTSVTTREVTTFFDNGASQTGTVTVIEGLAQDTVLPLYAIGTGFDLDANGYYTGRASVRSSITSFLGGSPQGGSFVHTAYNAFWTPQLNEVVSVGEASITGGIGVFFIGTLSSSALVSYAYPSTAFLTDASLHDYQYGSLYPNATAVATGKEWGVYAGPQRHILRPVAGYAHMQSILMALTRHFTDPNLVLDGATRSELAGYCETARQWKAQHMAEYTRSALVTGLNNVYTNPDFYYGFFIPTLFDLYVPFWPPQDPPPGWDPAKLFGGFTRKREREITSLEDAGQEGQVARFILSLKGQWEDGSPELDFNIADMTQTKPATLSHPPTPRSEYAYATKVMLYTAGQWTVHPDAHAIPDVLTFYGLARPGDIMGPWILNDLKKAINLLTHTIAGLAMATRSPATTDTLATDGLNLWTGGTFDQSTNTYGGDVNYSQGQDQDDYHHTGTPAGAVADYYAYDPVPQGKRNTLSNLVDTSFARQAAYSLFFGNYGFLPNGLTGYNYFLFSQCSQMYVWRPHNKLARSAVFYAESEIPPSYISGTTYVPVGDGINGWQWGTEDHNGQTFNGIMFQTADVAETTDDHMDGGLIGLPPIAPNWIPPDPVVAAVPGDSQVVGAVATMVAAVLKWDGPNGFKYTPTPRGV